MSKTSSVALVIILVVLALLAPWLTGVLTESHVTQRIAAMSDNAIFVAELRDYERGWFASTARVELTVSPRYLAEMRAGAPPAGDFLAQRVPVLVELRHGPLVLGDTVHFGMSTFVARSAPDAVFAAALREDLGMPYLFELRGRAGFGGGFDFDGDVPPIDYADGATELAFSGLAVDGALRGRRLVAAGSMESLVYRNPFSTAAAEGLHAAADYELRANDIALGSTDVALERITLASMLLGAEPLLDARALRLRNEVDLHDSGAHMRISIDYAGDSIAAGSQFALTEADLGVTLARLDAAAMRQYYALMRNAARGGIVGSGDLGAALAPVLERLLEAGPTLAFDPIRFAMSGEPFSATVRVETDPAALPPGRRNFQDPALWLAMASVDADAEISKGLAQDLAERFARMQLAGIVGDGPIAEDEVARMAEAQASLLLVMLAGQGYLEDAGDRYTAALRFAAGQLTVNGTRVPLGLP